MSLYYYSDYVNHCLRFYARYPRPRFKSRVDKRNWTACDAVLKGFPDHDREMLLTVYRDNRRIPESVYRMAKSRNISEDAVWMLIDDLGRKVAKKCDLL